MWTGNVHFYCTLRKEISLDSRDLKPIIFPVQKKAQQASSSAAYIFKATNTQRHHL